MARLGLDYGTLNQVNPKLIMCSISGYGQAGPRAFEAGHDINYMGLTGVLDLSRGSTVDPYEQSSNDKLEVFMFALLRKKDFFDHRGHCFTA